jgi:hypothetical protein
MPWEDIDKIARADQPTEHEKRQVIEYVRRRAKPRFYADENFPPRATSILRGMGADVLTVQEARTRGHPDENHMAQARKLGRVLITCDRDYLNERRFPLIHCSVIVVCDFGSKTAGEIWDVFSCLHGIFVAPQFSDKWTKIDAKRQGWTVYERFQNGKTARTRYRVYQGKLQEWVST